MPGVQPAGRCVRCFLIDFLTHLETLSGEGDNLTRGIFFASVSATFFRRMAISGYELYVTFLFIFLALYSSSKRNIINHIRKKLYGLYVAERGKQEMGYLYPNDKLLLHRGMRPWCYKNGYCLADSKKGRKAG